MPTIGHNVAYKGYSLKSRVEFAWAQEFDALGFTWEYEAITFRSEEGKYTPDFAIDGRALFIETKTYGARNLENKFHLCRAPLLIIFGLPTRCYIRFKPAGATRLQMGHMKTFAQAYALARKVAA